MAQNLAVSAPFEVYRIGSPGAPAPSSLDGLDVLGFASRWADRRVASSFTGPGSTRINLGEAFFRDACQVASDGGLSLPNPFDSGRLVSGDIVACESAIWPTVPVYIARVSGPEPWAFVKRGLSWCTDLGLVFPTRRVFVSLQDDPDRVAQDLGEVVHAEAWFATRGRTAFSPADARSSRPTCLLMTSEHFAHHLWNELSVLDGLVDAGAHRHLHVLVGHQSIAPLTSLFPELRAAQIETVPGQPSAPIVEAGRRDWNVVPAGRRYLPQTVVDRVLRVVRDEQRTAAADAERFRRGHSLVLWLTLRLDARTATNLCDALGHLVRRAAARYPGLGVIVDGFTIPADATAGWNQALIAAERNALESLVNAFRGVDCVVLPGKPTAEALAWTAAADYYVCPYGTAHHKIAWLRPIPGTVHAGENKRLAADRDPGVYARQAGPPPQFVFSPVTRTDAATDVRSDLFSYALDVEAVTTAVLTDLAVRVTPRTHAV